MLPMPTYPDINEQRPFGRIAEAQPDRVAMFLIGVRILSGTVTARQAGEAYGRLADAVIRAVHRAIGDNFAAAHGHMVCTIRTSSAPFS